MKNHSPLPYLPNLFASCMVFMVIYTLCVLLWIWMPEMPGHVILTTLIPSFKLLDFANFCYGMMMSAIYGWFIAGTYVFFHNLWPKLLHLISVR